MRLHKNMSTKHAQVHSVTIPSTGMSLEKGRKAPSNFCVCLQGLACHASLYSQKNAKPNSS